jgi:modulator of FtsH protease
VSAYTTAGWESFFVAEVGAAAALAGLLFVALSINLSKVLAFPQLPGRAAEGLLALVGILVASTLGLVPGQARVLFGVELAVLGGAIWGVPVWMQSRVAHDPKAPRYWMIVRVATHQLSTVPMVVAGVSLLAQVGGGLYWLVPATILSFAASLINSWVLLVEIQR